MLLRILASGAVFLVVVTLAAVAAAVWLDDFTLYSTRDGWVGSAASVGVVATLLASVLISVGYFRSYSPAGLRYQPYANVVFVLLAAVTIAQTELGGELGGEVVPHQLVEVKVLPETFSVEGRTGTDVVAMLAEVMSPNASDDKQLVLYAPSEVEYGRLQDTLRRLHEAGYSNIGLSTDMPETH